jgi:hypothetical protein
VADALMPAIDGAGVSREETPPGLQEGQASGADHELAVRSMPRTITWCRVPGASRRAWRGMIERSLTQGDKDCRVPYFTYFRTMPLLQPWAWRGSLGRREARPRPPSSRRPVRSGSHGRPVASPPGEAERQDVWS